MRDEMRDTPLMLAPAKTMVRYEPLGVALIFGSWNYPYVVNLKPLCQAITSGNCAVIKPSEMSPASSTVIRKLVEKYLDKDCFAVIEGGVEIAAKICHYPWDLICFTGSTMKGKLVAEAAGKNLIPCILELGGKCPSVVDTSADINFAANKVAFGRFNNSGQTCLAPDYAIVHESVKDQFVDALQKQLRNMYGNEENGSPDMGKIITDWHCDRLKSLIDSSKGKVVCGGKVNRNIKYVEPTIILNPEAKSPVMQEEIFGPVIPVITFKNIDEVVELINSKDKPLAIYYYGKCYNNPNSDKLLNETSSGAYVVNEAII
jgi:aldehyde dehydrogenase (NAD+)